MNSYRTSNGDRVSKATIDRRVVEAKKTVLNEIRISQGYISCVDCGINENAGVPIDMSHTISVDQCQKQGRSELAWDTKNIRPRCRKCHNLHDKTY